MGLGFSGPVPRRTRRPDGASRRHEFIHERLSGLRGQRRIGHPPQAAAHDEIPAVGSGGMPARGSLSHFARPADRLAPGVGDARRGGRLLGGSSSIQVGAWSLAPSCPRASRSTLADRKRGAKSGLSNR